ncbi:MAG: triose-phosphate isomerase [Firmicutes bacterium]|nr:triose-phosphate isomerase [Bacillota bacterium]
MARRPLIAGNWKMYKTTKEALEFVKTFGKIYDNTENLDAAICAPFTQLTTLREAIKGTDLFLGAQNVHFADEGAYTGEISLAMLTEIGIDYCIIGHSERRQYFNETDEAINNKLKHMFWDSQVIPILCVGENLTEREEGRAQEVVKFQLEKDLADLSEDRVESMVIAYEPIWAIGTGKTATPQQAGEMCTMIRETLKEIYDEEVSQGVRIQYGGSVKAANIQEILSMEDVDGALVGGASLEPEKFAELLDLANSL